MARLKKWLSIVVVMSMHFWCSSGNKSNNSTEKSKKVRINKYDIYDPKMPPSHYTGRPTLVPLSLEHFVLKEIDEKNLLCHVQMSISYTWVLEKPNLRNRKYDRKLNDSCSNGDATRYWNPEIYFFNDIHGCNNCHLRSKELLCGYENSLLSFVAIYFYLHRNTSDVIVACEPNLKLFPFDLLTCSIQFMSYHWNTDDVIYEWNPYYPVKFSKYSNWNKNIIMKFLGYNLLNDTKITYEGTYSFMKVDLIFRYDFKGNIFVQLYVLSSIPVSLSWVPFWLNESALLARVSLGVTALLSLITQISSIIANTPIVSEIKAAKVWLYTCLIFIIGSLLELALVKFMPALDVSAKRTVPITDVGDFKDGTNSLCMVKSDSKKPLMNLELATSEDTSIENVVRSRFVENHLGWIPRYQIKSKHVDILSRIFFPTSFIVFTMYYWIKYFPKDDDIDIQHKLKEVEYDFNYQSHKLEEILQIEEENLFF